MILRRHRIDGMGTGDRVLVVLGAKVACCALLVSAVAGVPGGLGAWLIEGSGRWVLGGTILALIVWAACARRRRVAEGERRFDMIPAPTSDQQSR